MRARRGQAISKTKKGTPLTAKHKAALKCPPGCTCAKHDNANSGQFGQNNPGFRGRHHSAETKAAISGKTTMEINRRYPGASKRADLAKTNPRAFASWQWMMSRCFDPRNASFKYYGRRGITVCRRWRTFANFVRDMGERPEGRYQIGRINHDRDYKPSNCRWEEH
jgi:hypothetical protein